MTFVTAEVVLPVHIDARRRRIIFSAPHDNLAELAAGIRRYAERRQIKGDAMRNYIRSIWTCAALYVAIGLIGIVLLTTRPGVATSSDGYGIADIAPRAALR